MQADLSYSCGLHQWHVLCLDDARGYALGLEGEHRSGWAGQALASDIAFLAAAGVSPALLARATLRAAITGAQAHALLIGEGAIRPEVYRDALARESGVDTALAGLQPIRPPILADCLRHGVVACRTTGGQVRLLVAMDAPHVGALAEGRFSSETHVMTLATRPDFERLLIRSFPDLAAREIIDRFPLSDEVVTAADGMAPAQAALLAALALMLADWVLRDGIWSVALASIALTVLFVAPLGLQIASMYGMQRSREPPPPPIPTSRLPGYTVLVPLYREAGMVRPLLAALDRLDYPRDRLEVIILVEPDDDETIEAMRDAPVLPFARMLVLPPVLREPSRAPSISGFWRRRASASRFMMPRIVPIPCNCARAAARLMRNPRLGCVQAPLVTEDADGNWFRRMFALEYAGLFQVQKPGAAALGLPVPLGGTSTISASIPARIGGWDAHNVTEDADLGLRLYRAGLSIETIPEATREEAPGRFTDWLGQRRRWLKGWFQTAISHTQRPFLQNQMRRSLAYAARFRCGHRQCAFTVDVSGQPFRADRARPARQRLAG